MADMGGIEPLPEIENNLDTSPPPPEHLEEILRFFRGPDADANANTHPNSDIANNWQVPSGDFPPFPIGNTAPELPPYPGGFCENIPTSGFDPSSYPDNIHRHPVDGTPGDSSGTASKHPSPLTGAEAEAEAEELDLTGCLANRPSNKRAHTPADNSPAPDAPQTKKQKRSRRKRDEPEPDYSAIIRAQVKNTTRTGQACDRCKVKRMKCDSEPMGCAICQLHGKDCRVTDLTTGATTTRGEMQRMQEELEESRNQVLVLNCRVHEFEGQVRKYEMLLRGFGSLGDVDQLYHSACLSNSPPCLTPLSDQHDIDQPLSRAQSQDFLMIDAN